MPTSTVSASWLRNSSLRPGWLLACALTALPMGGCPADGGAAEGGDGDGVGPDPVIDVSPVLTTVRARAIGRLSSELRVEVSGSDLQDDAAGIDIRLVSPTGADVIFFDSDFDGLVDAARAFVPFDQAAIVAEDHSFTATVTVAAIPAVPDLLASVDVGVVDAQGNASPGQTAPVVVPPEVGAGQACDPLFIENRCGADLGCKGTPTVCAPPEAPVLSRLAYLTPAQPETAGPRLLLEGIDADQDVVVVHLEFMDAEGTPVALDLDGDDIGDASTFDLELDDNDGTVNFSAFQEMGLFLQDTVQQVAATAEDAGGRVGERLVATLSTAPIRQSGQACSALGFDVCVDGSVCNPGATGATACQAEGALRTTQCREAATMTLSGPGEVSLVGVVDGPSVWDPPTDCSPNDPTHRPEAVVQLVLENDVARLTISTNTPQTTFDTVVYVLSTCTTDGDVAMRCADDAEQSVASTIELLGVAAGTYAIVIDSFGPAGGSYGVSAIAD